MRTIVFNVTRGKKRTRISDFHFRFFNSNLEDHGDDGITLGPHFEAVRGCVPQRSVVPSCYLLVRCRRLQDYQYHEVNMKEVSSGPLLYLFVCRGVVKFLGN